jgi:D-alanine-D-alanine ligase
MRRKIRLGILFGGKSAEHEVALQSTRSIVKALDGKKYEIVLIGIAKDGLWYRFDPARFLVDADDPSRIALARPAARVTIAPGRGGAELVTLSGRRGAERLDVVFPVLHGPFGEDGTVQGMLKLAGAAFVGASVLGSSVGMDKDVMKRLLRDARLPIGRFLVFHRSRRREIGFDAARRAVGLPMFFKPANMGSSVGISKVRSRKEFDFAIKEAFRYDDKIIIEEFIRGREIECSVLGNENPVASLPGEVIPRREFYSYEAKYIDDDGAALEIPARVPPSVVRNVQDLAVRSYRALCCEGMARVDLFLRGKGELLLNEINTIPGFTKISMYPKLWEVSGLPYGRLLDRLISLALERHRAEKRLDTNFRAV